MDNNEFLEKFRLCIDSLPRKIPEGLTLTVIPPASAELRESLIEQFRGEVQNQFSPMENSLLLVEDDIDALSELSESFKKRFAEMNKRIQRLEKQYRDLNTNLSSFKKEAE